MMVGSSVFLFPASREKSYYCSFDIRCTFPDAFSLPRRLSGVVIMLHPPVRWTTQLFHIGIFSINSRKNTSAYRLKYVSQYSVCMLIELCQRKIGGPDKYSTPCITIGDRRKIFQWIHAPASIIHELTSVQSSNPVHTFKVKRCLLRSYTYIQSVW